jgi:NAD(P)-dependent dehydrogenase (short-subunit alcohol dehydrogenase family)
VFRLNDKTALVLGGASGIGEAIARTFVARGAAVTIGDVDAARACAVASQLSACWERVDVTDWPNVREVVERVIARAGALDILVNSAGIMHVGKLHETEVEDYDRVQAVNARGVFLACRAVIGHMLERGRGNIINLASVASLIAVERRFAYCVSKGAVLELTRALAIDYARDGIRVNAICPGTVDTPMIRGYVQRYFARDFEGTLRGLHERQPVGRMGKPEEVAALAVYLASDESAFVTGAAIPIDGGWTAK